MAPTKDRIVFLHPDLGIGGAERLVIDAAVGLQERGHKVTIFTSHCDPKHCFDEVRDGTLEVRVRGNSIVPPSLFGRFAILCAILRQFHLILQIAFLSSELRTLEPSAFFIDQLSAGVPLLRLLCPQARILFYCHFPDKLLAKKGGLLKSFYRLPFDWLESWSTGYSDGIVVNSKFTRQIFGEAFPRLNYILPGVVYPCVDISQEIARHKEQLWQGQKVFLSINRFERKKDVGLAIRAYAGLSEAERQGTRLVIAGGYDPRVAENVQYHSELESLADSLGLSHATARAVPTALAIPGKIAVLFMLSVPSVFKATLLSAAALLIYTPRNEHFGIVPLEAMLAGVPVLAADEGGPLETVADGKTGWLRDVDDEKAWTAVMRLFCDGSLDDQDLEKMGVAGRRRVKENFSRDKIAAKIEEEMKGLKNAPRPALVGPVFWMMAFALIPAVLAIAYRLYVWMTGSSVIYPIPGLVDMFGPQH